ncbi:U3 small nucleolar RNA-associated protein 4-like protein [Acropora cervicornis]|uniref:U3 small nucleolar RNA-associated protein 4-like protein n=1 Tax=Acropora cervicornis TaxID=6130 RepID=A0AAD9PWY4_ACRCE|nr:U3 small nucleolar RNA-associated protein 4-like protein [Acropora cervicornis]
MYYAVDYINTFYFGRVVSVEGCFVELKFLHSKSSTSYDWPRTDDVDRVHYSCIFYGPVLLEGNYPFTISSQREVQKVHRFIRKQHKDTTSFKHLFAQKIIPGCNGTSVESLDWCKGRLFTAGLHAELTEWNLNSLCPKVTVDSFGGAVWCLTVNRGRTCIAAGCEDGSVRLFEITDDGRVLCVSWHQNDNMLVTGASDSTVRVFNVTSGMNFNCWNFVIVTGDSLGNTQFWDGKHGTLLQSFRAHMADVLAVCVNEEEDMVFSGGVDSKIVQFREITNKDGVSTWVKAGSERMFSQDVRCLATFSGNQKTLISGGKTYMYLLKGTVQSPLVFLASAANILVHQKSNGLQFWKLEKTVDKSTASLRSPVHLVEIKKKGDYHILCSAISPCASWAAFSDVHHISLFKLSLETDGKSQVKVTKVFPLPVELLPAKKLNFTSDSSKLVIATCQGLIQILTLEDESRLMYTLKIPCESQDPLSISLVAVSEDGHWLACSDSTRTINIFSLKKRKLKNTLPRLDSPVTALAFQPGTNNLAVICCNHQLYVFKPSNARLTDWSRHALQHGLPEQWRTRRSKVINIEFHPRDHHIILLQDREMFTLLDFNEPLPNVDDILYESKLPLLYAGFAKDASLVVVERPWKSIVERLPPPLYRKKYAK